jgi:hypothetical protein
MDESVQVPGAQSVLPCHDGNGYAVFVSEFSAHRDPRQSFTVFVSFRLQISENPAHREGNAILFARIFHDWPEIHVACFYLNNKKNTNSLNSVRPNDTDRLVKTPMSSNKKDEKMIQIPWIW